MTLDIGHWTNKNDLSTQLFNFITLLPNSTIIFSFLTLYQTNIQIFRQIVIFSLTFGYLYVIISNNKKIKKGGVCL